jgi:hypothetical protein
VVLHRREPPFRRSCGFPWALADHSSELVFFEARDWSSRDMRLLVEQDARVSRVVLLFTAWLVACLAQDESSAAGTAAVAATVSA